MYQLYFVSEDETITIQANIVHANELNIYSAVFNAVKKFNTQEDDHGDTITLVKVEADRLVIDYGSNYFYLVIKADKPQELYCARFKLGWRSKL